MNKSVELPKTNQYGTAKLPPGQLHTEKFPVMTYGPTPVIEREHWGLRIHGLVSEEKEWHWKELLALPQTTLKADFHCVTHWSRFDDDWTGILFKDFWEERKILLTLTQHMLCNMLTEATQPIFPWLGCLKKM